jgi:mono/diheme cytochrome c family protein
MRRLALQWALALVLTAGLAACAGSEPTAAPAMPVPDTSASTAGEGQPMGPGSGMMDRHHASVPAPYAGLTNPVAADLASLDRAADLYSTLCASCHGDGGMGDGPAGIALDPAPAPVAHSSQMLGDDMLFWRVSEGGVMEPFSSTMPAWKGSLDEQARWDLVNYLRALGTGSVTPRQSAGGAAFDPAAEGAARAEMLSQGVSRGVITQEEADQFDRVHGAMNELMAEQGAPQTGSMAQIRGDLLDVLVDLGKVTREQADLFDAVHDRLVEAGLME